MLFHIVGISYKHPTNPFLLTQSESDVKDYNVVSVSVLRWTPTGSDELEADVRYNIQLMSPMRTK